MNAIGLQRIAASVAQERAVDTVLERIVAELHAQPHIALVRIWLLDTREHCDVCAKSGADGSAIGALHLAAGAGTSLHKQRNEDWSKLSGQSRCIQLGNGKVGRIGATGESVFVEDAGGDQRWSMNRDWIRTESIDSFAGHPLVSRGKIVGVIVLFSRERLTQADFELLRAFADLAAVAIANARDFEEVERRRMSLEAENNFLRNELDRSHAIGRLVAASPALDEPRRRLSAAVDGLLPIGAYSQPTGSMQLTRDDLRRVEKDNLRSVLAETNWKIYGPRGAAEVLKMKPTTLSSRLKSLGIRKPVG